MSSLILVNGEEDFLMERAVRDELSILLIDDVSHYTLPDDIENFLYSCQIPLLSNAPRAFVLHEVSEVPVLPESPGDVVICVAKSAKKPLCDSRAKRVHNFPKLRSYADNNEVIGWILKEGGRLNIDLSRVAPALFVNCGSNLRKISSEIEKMSVLTPRDAVVSPDEARALMCFSAELSPQQIIDAICDGNTPKALAFYDKLQEAAEETGWIIAYMQRMVLQQFKFELLREKKASDAEAAESLGVHPFVYKKMILGRQNLWRRSSLLYSINTLCELDLAHKRGDAFARFGLESEIIRLSEESKNVKR